MKPESTKTWNPGGDHNYQRRKNLVKINIPTQIYSFLSTVMIFNVDLVDDDDTEVEESSKMKI